MKSFAVALSLAILAVAMAAPPKTEEKKDLQASPSLLYGGIGLGYPIGLGLYGGYGLGLGYGLGIHRLGLLGLGYGGIIG